MGKGPSVYLAFDPGGTTGWAMFDEEGKLTSGGSITGREGLYEFLDAIPETIRETICEDYRLYDFKSKQQSWSPMDTVRFIGAIEYWCHIHKVGFHLQGANVKTIAYKWAGIKTSKSKAMSHETDAYVHGVYYLQNAGVRSPQQGRELL